MNEGTGRAGVGHGREEPRMKNHTRRLGVGQGGQEKGREQGAMRRGRSSSLRGPGVRWPQCHCVLTSWSPRLAQDTLKACLLLHGPL